MPKGRSLKLRGSIANKHSKSESENQWEKLYCTYARICGIFLWLNSQTTQGLHMFAWFLIE
jgi:hypothetical protein